MSEPTPQQTQAKLSADGVVVRKQGPWSLWWLTIITLSIYYLVWYHRVNRELAAWLGDQHAGNGQWWSQIIPFYNLYGLSQTAKRVNAAHAQVGSTTVVSPVMTWLWSPLRFGSHTRYVQRRMNLLRDLQAASAFADDRYGRRTRP